MATSNGRIRNAWIGTALVVLNTLVLVLLVELGARGVLALREAFRAPDPIEDVDEATLALAYPGRDAEQIHGARDEVIRTQVYAPWVQFRGPDQRSERVNVEGFVRRSVPAMSRVAALGNYFDVYFFGGSTMQGSRVGDDETIPAHFARIAGERDETLRPVRVHNYGQPYYYSLQESTLLYSLLMQGARPQAAVFLDGLNDVLQPGSTIRREPFWTPKLEVLFEEDPASMSTAESASALWRASGVRRLLAGAGVLSRTEGLRSSYTPPPELDESEIADRILGKYLANVEATRRLCRAFEVDCYFFWQPVPYYRYPNRDRDSFAIQESSTLFESAYALMDERSRVESDPVFLADMLEHEDGYPFVDPIHYSSSFQARIAERMLQTVRLP
jgi:hypothetical protein